MKASLSWLNEYVDIKGIKAEEIADNLTMIGLEVEELKDYYDYLEDIIVAKIVSASPLPNSEHLKLCVVEAGSYGTFTVVCGAENAKDGLISALAIPGAILPNGLEIKVSQLRGQKSEGMLCSAEELYLSNENGGILEYPQFADKVGENLKSVLKKEEWVVEIGITPNRSDALSLIGIARDLSAKFKTANYKIPLVTLEESDTDVHSLAKVNIEAPDHAYRYVARVVENIEIKESPFWLQERLRLLGVRPINNIVDVTNYVMLEYGLPLHAFDLNSLKGREINVKQIKEEIKFTTLDGQERDLKKSQNLFICDAENPVALAGIMGGKNSVVTDKTTEILLEAACFNPTTIRRSSRYLGLSTEASFRYERGCDVEICGTAVDRAASLIAQISGGKIAKGRIDVYPRPHKYINVSFSPKACNKILGTNFESTEMISALEKIGLTVLGDNDKYTVTLPSWRPDMHREIDVVEEVARLLDYNKLPVTLPAPTKLNRTVPPRWVLRNKIRTYMKTQGFVENISYSFLNKNFAPKMLLEVKSIYRNNIVPIVNPLIEDHSVLRTLITPCLLNALKVNQNNNIFSVSLYEVGATFIAKNNEAVVTVQPNEVHKLAILWAGKIGGKNWCEAERNVDFWDIKGLIEGLADYLSIQFQYTENPETLMPYYEQGQAANICLPDGKVIGHFGLLNPTVKKGFAIKKASGDTFALEMDIDALLDVIVLEKQFKPLPRYPKVDRDMALILNTDISSLEVCQTIRNSSPHPFKEVFIFDVYEGEQVPDGKKSLALRLVYQDENKTLTDEAVNKVYEEIINILLKKYSASLRS